MSHELLQREATQSDICARTDTGDPRRFAAGSLRQLKIVVSPVRFRVSPFLRCLHVALGSLLRAQAR